MHKIKLKMICVLLVLPTFSFRHHSARHYQNTHLTIFESLGEMVPETAFIHILAPVDILNFAGFFTKAIALLRTNAENVEITAIQRCQILQSSIRQVT